MRTLARRSLALVSLAPIFVAGTAHADTLSVAKGGTYATPCAAIAAAKAGDTIEVASGDYVDACKVTKSLTIRGVGARPVISALLPIPNQKGIFAVEGAEVDVTFENLELKGATVPDQNGAGIRAQGRALVVRGCVFRDNEDGILGGDNGTVTIEHSTFDSNGDGKGQAHNVYIGHAKKLIFQGNYSRAAKVGHLLKSRAEENIVLANRLTGEDGNQSYESDFPNGGRTLFAFNLVHQGPSTDNGGMVAYAMEGASNAVNELTIVHNTFVNGRGSGTFVNVKGDFTGKANFVNNIFQGGGTLTTYAGASLAGNVEGDAALVDVAGFDFHLTAGSKAKDAGVDASAFLGGQALLQYVHPAGDAPRTNAGAGPDVGAYELGDTGAGGGSGGTGGTTGTAGTGGTTGTAGMAGTAGTTGTAGMTGTAGTTGTAGMTGTAGTTGTAGMTGTAGTTGTAGMTGTAGTAGATGTAGTAGAAGVGGTVGAAGTTGTAGATGTAGKAGALAGGAAGKAAAGAAGAAGANAVAPAASEEDSGCGCRVAGSEHDKTPAGLALVGLGLGLLAARRRR